MRAAEKFHMALSYAVVLFVTLIVLAGIFVPMMVEQGGYMAAVGIPVMGLCMGYLVSTGMLRMIQAYKRMIRSRD